MGFPTFVLKDNLFYFSAERKHMGFHPGKEAIDAFSGRLGKLTHTKTLQSAHALGIAPGNGGVLRAGAFEISTLCLRSGLPIYPFRDMLSSGSEVEPMMTYVTGTTIKQLREARNMT